MDKFPLCWQGKAAGELTTEREALYTCFSAQCCLPGRGLWCAWIVGDRGELRLGILEPGERGACIRRRFSHRMADPLGRVLRGELRPVEAAEQESWVPVEAHAFQTPWLHQQLRQIPGALTRMTAQRRFLAVPYSEKKPFPLPPLFCFARVRRIGGEEYVVFAFDPEEWPVQD